MAHTTRFDIVPLRIGARKHARISSSTERGTAAEARRSGITEWTWNFGLQWEWNPADAERSPDQETHANRDRSGSDETSGPVTFDESARR